MKYLIWIQSPEAANIFRAYTGGFSLSTDIPPGEALAQAKAALPFCASRLAISHPHWREEAAKLESSHGAE